MNAWTIAQKELNSYFRSPVAYAVMTAFAVIQGLFFFFGTLGFVNAAQERAMAGQATPMNVNEWLIGPLLSNLLIVFLLLLPIITMRLLAEEKRSGTIELLATSPIHDWEIVVGKWLSAVVLYAALLGLSAVNIGTLFAYGSPDWRPIVVAYLGLLLQGGALLALGLFISSLSKNQIVAAVVSYMTFLGLYILDWSTAFGNSTLTKVLGYLAFVSHYESFARGVIDTKDLVYYLSMIALGLFLTARSMDSIRWRA
jgi:ABC-2 type transport system permease protein